MQASLTARRTKRGQQEAFRRQWAGGTRPKGLREAYLLEDERDPRNTLSLGVWDSPGRLLAYRASDAAKRREEQLRGLVDKTRRQRPFAAFRATDIETGGRNMPLLLLLPLLLAAVGVAVVVFRKRRRQGPAEEPASPDELAASGDGPPAALSPVGGTASGSAAGVVTPGAGAATA